MNRKHEKRLQNLAKALREHKGHFNMNHHSDCAFAVYAQSQRQRTFSYAHGYTRLRGIDAYISYQGPEVREHFGITGAEQQELFGGVNEGRQTLSQVADFVDEFIQRKRRARRKLKLV